MLRYRQRSKFQVLKLTKYINASCTPTSSKLDTVKQGSPTHTHMQKQSTNVVGRNPPVLISMTDTLNESIDMLESIKNTQPSTLR